MVVLQTKFLVPGFTLDRVPRPRLVRSVRAHLERGTALLVAPPGYGKTTLAAEVAASYGERVVWLQLDQGDDDPTAFVTAWAEGVARTFPDLRAALAELLQAGRSLGAERLATMVVNLLLTSVDGPWLLVLDDLHLVTNPHVHAIVARWVELAPPHARTLIVSRAQPPLPLARWRARGLLGEVQVDELRFTSEEAAPWLQRTLPGLSPASVARLVARTEGWGAGLRLAGTLLAGARGEDATADALAERLGGSHPSVAAYLLDEVFARQDAEVQRFLLETSVLPRMDAASCTDLTTLERGAGERRAQSMLERLEHEGAFVQRLGSDARWFRYHHLFQEFLLERLRRQDPGLTARLHRRAAWGCEGRGELEQAAGFYLAAGDLSDAARLLERYGSDHLRRGLVEALHRTLVQLEGELHAWPRLRLLHGRVLQARGRLTEAAVALAHAQRSARVRGDVDVGCAALTALAAIARSQGDYVRAHAFAVRASEGGDAVPAITLASALMERAKSEGMLSGMARGRELADEALATVSGVDADVAPHLHASLLRSSAQIAWWHGDAAAAIRHGRAALDLLDDDDPLAADVRLTLSTPTLYRHDPEGAIALAEHALERYGRYHLRERVPAAYAVLGNALTRSGDLVRAEGCLRTAIDLAAEIGGARFDQVMAAGYLAHNLGLQGRAAEAIGVAETALWPHHGSPVTYEVFVCRSVLADAYLAAGREAAAERIYRELVPLGEARQYRIPLAMVHFGLAYLRLRAGDRVEGLHQAERSLAMLAPTQAWQLWADQGDRSALIIDALAPTHTGDPFLARVAERAGANARARTSAAVPRAMEIDLLGELRVRVAGVPLEPKAWVSTKARDLLAFLATVRGEGVTVERVLAALWPDTPEREKTAVHTALYRLRNALRRLDADAGGWVIAEGRSYRLDVSRFSTDVERFESLLHAARGAAQTHRSELLQRAVDLVRGEYLAGMDYAWLEPERQRLAEAHAGALAALADARLGEGRAEDALELARRQLAVDPLRERAHVQVMQALHALGDRGGVERQWHDLTSLLATELGVAPLDESHRAYESLRT